jgi:hypothetical protein
MKTSILSLLYVITTYCTITSALLAKDTPIDIAESKLLYKDDFNGDLSQWVIEQMTGGTTTIKNEQLDINDAKGCTVWFKHKLTGAIMIEFEASLIKKGGQYDRLSDLNCFWMATDPKNPKDLFANQKRGGLFKNYHPLRLYYVGYGANHNTTTRFRRYPGDSSRPCLPGHDLQDPQNPVGRILTERIYTSTSYNYILYNEAPPKGPHSATKGHTKGLQLYFNIFTAL